MRVDLSAGGAALRLVCLTCPVRDRFSDSVRFSVL